MGKKCRCPNCQNEIYLEREHLFGKKIIECKACGEKVHLKFGKVIKDYDKIENIVPEEIVVDSFENDNTENSYYDENSAEQTETAENGETNGEETPKTEDISESESKNNDFEKKKAEKKRFGSIGLKNIFSKNAFSSENPDSAFYAVKMQYRAWKNANKKIVWILRGISVILICAAAFAVYISNLIPVGLDSRDLTDMNYKTVVKLLEDNGFTDVEAVPNEDLDISEISKDNTVKYVEIGGESDFEKDDHFLKGRNISVVYRTMRRINLPLSSKELENRNYLDVAQMLVGEGFTNITCEPKRDLLIGVINKEGEVDEIIVDGKKKFNKKDRYRPDTEIIIKYHAFKEKD